MPDYRDGPEEAEEFLNELEEGDRVRVTADEAEPDQFETFVRGGKFIDDSGEVVESGNDEWPVVRLDDFRVQESDGNHFARDFRIAGESVIALWEPEEDYEPEADGPGDFYRGPADLQVGMLRRIEGE